MSNYDFEPFSDAMLPVARRLCPAHVRARLDRSTYSCSKDVICLFDREAQGEETELRFGKEHSASGPKDERQSGDVCIVQSAAGSLRC